MNELSNRARLNNLLRSARVPTTMWVTGRQAIEIHEDWQGAPVTDTNLVRELCCLRPLGRDGKPLPMSKLERLYRKSQAK